MALFQMQGKVPEVKDKLMTLVTKGRKASRHVFSSLVGMVSDRQVVGFALYRSHPTSLRVTGSKDDIFGRSFGKVKGTLRWSSGLKDLHVFNFILEKTSKAFCK